jgi:hypothetical protein
VLSERVLEDAHLGRGVEVQPGRAAVLHQPRQPTRLPPPLPLPLQLGQGASLPLQIYYVLNTVTCFADLE